MKVSLYLCVSIVVFGGQTACLAQGQYGSNKRLSTDISVNWVSFHMWLSFCMMNSHRVLFAFPVISVFSDFSSAHTLQKRQKLLSILYFKSILITSKVILRQDITVYLSLFRNLWPFLPVPWSRQLKVEPPPGCVEKEIFSPLQPTEKRSFMVKSSLGL